MINYDNLIGTKYGKLTLLGIDMDKNKENEIRRKNGEIKTRSKYLLFECECGNIISCQFDPIRKGIKTSCGCDKIKHEDLTNKVFGRLKVLEFDKNRTELDKERYNLGKIKGRNTYWKCKCECGNITTVCSSNLKSGTTTSCGCYFKENLSKIKTKRNKIEIVNNEIIIYDKNNNFCKIDFIDKDLVDNYCWYVNNKGYWCTNILIGEKKTVRCLHQLIGLKKYGELYDVGAKVIDHIDRNKNNNKRNNLELKTQAENNKNFSKNKNNTSGKVGVHYDKTTNKWIAQISINGKRKHLGSFKNFEDAVICRLDFENKLGYIGE